MGMAQIIGGGAGGRYTIRVDLGQAQKTATVARLDELIVQLDARVTAAYDRWVLAQAKTEEQRGIVNTAIAQYITAVQDTILSGSVPPQDAHNAAQVQAQIRAFDAYRRDLARMAADDAGARLAYEAAKFDRARAAAELARWTAFEPLQEKDVWCTDLTEDAAGTVATIDVDGDGTLTLVAEGGRVWLPGDGTVAEADKAAALEALNAKRARLVAARSAAETRLTAAVAAETTLGGQLAAAQATYQAAPTAESAQAVTVAAAALSQQRVQVFSLQAKLADLDQQLARLDERIAQWEARTASPTPNPGDGRLVSSVVQSPAQFFWNEAVLPGWQKWKPMYRRGVITALNFDTDTASVDLDAATSRAQGLNLNRVTSLAAVPVVYMTCNARAFEVGDRCIVKFAGMDWASPTVIGFVDNPQPCLMESAAYRTVGFYPFGDGGLDVFALQEKSQGDDWDAVSAPTATGHFRFLGWDDGVSTLARSDGPVLDSIVKTAQYAMAPPTSVYFGWAIQLTPTSEPYFIGQNYVRDWQMVVQITRTTTLSTSAPYTLVTPANILRSYVAWAGQALGGMSGDDVLQALLEPEGLPVQSTDPPGPVLFQSGDLVTATGQGFSFRLGGSSPVHGITANSLDTPIPARIPYDEGYAGAYVLNYTPTDWSLSWS